MRLSSCLTTAALALASLTSCGGPAAAKYFKVAIDARPYLKINRAETPSCYVDTGNTNTPTVTTTTTVDNNPGVAEWTIWEGADGVIYLEAGNLTFTLGDAPSINASGMVQGTAKELTFPFKKTTVTTTDLSSLSTKYTETRIVGATVTFKDLANTTSGTIALQSSYTCAAAVGQCPDPKNNPSGKGSCSVSMPFIARQIPVTELTSFGSP